MAKILSISFLCLFLFLSLSSSITYAEDSSASASTSASLGLTVQKVNPGTVSYPLKRLWEKIREKFINSANGKINFYEELAKTRLSELNYVVDNKMIGEVQTSSQRFAYFVGKLTDLVSASNNDQTKKKFFAEFDKYQSYLTKIRDSYEYNTSYWMLIEHSINSLKLYKEKLTK